jgi:acetoin utilization deacetylase AcuC-like enzyme
MAALPSALPTSFDEELLDTAGNLYRFCCTTCTSPLHLKLPLGDPKSLSSAQSAHDEELDLAASVEIVEFAKAVRDRSHLNYELKAAAFDHELRLMQWRQKKQRYDEWTERRKKEELLIDAESTAANGDHAPEEGVVADPGPEPALPVELENAKQRLELPPPPKLPLSLLRRQKCVSCGATYSAPTVSANATMIAALIEREKSSNSTSSNSDHHTPSDNNNNEDKMMGSGQEHQKTLPLVDPAVPIVNMDILAETLKPHEDSSNTSHTRALMTSLGLSEDFIKTVLTDIKSSQTSHNHHHSHSSSHSQIIASSALPTSTCIVFDEKMLLHEEFKRNRHSQSSQTTSASGLPTIIPQPHPERPDRLRSVAQHLVAAGLFQRCERLESREVTREEASCVHDASLLDAIDDLPSRIEKGDGQYDFDTGDTFANVHTLLAARLACGSTLAVTEAVARGKTARGLALVRPPGHHAEPDRAMGFCVYNNVGVAAAVARKKWGVNRVLILDWDVHHGNGTEKMFYSDPTVLYVSLHRYDKGTFYPGTGHVSSVGVNEGAGYNVNIAWEKEGMGDADYIHAFDELIMPIAHSFNPELVLVSAGFDAARGDPLGGCDLTPRGYAQMTHRLLSLAKGKVVVALEGGYNLSSISRGMEAVLRVLLGEAPPPLIPIPASTHAALSDSAKGLHYAKAGRKLDAFSPSYPDVVRPTAIETELKLSSQLSSNSSTSEILSSSSKDSSAMRNSLLFDARSAVLAAELTTEETSFTRDAASEGAERRDQLQFAAPQDEAIAAVSIAMHCLARYWPCLEAKVRAQDSFSRAVLGHSSSSSSSLSKRLKDDIDGHDDEDEDEDNGDKDDDKDNDKPFFDTIAGPMRNQILQILRGRCDDEGVDLFKAPPSSSFDDDNDDDDDEDEEGGRGGRGGGRGGGPFGDGDDEEDEEEDMHMGVHEGEEQDEDEEDDILHGDNKDEDQSNFEEVIEEDKDEEALTSIPERTSKKPRIDY